MDGRIVDVTVVSKDVRRLTRARSNRMIQNLGPRLNCEGLSFVVASLLSTEASLDSRAVEADTSCCCDMVTDRGMRRCCWAGSEFGCKEREKVVCEQMSHYFARVGLI
jgi:hypothetical protein